MFFRQSSAFGACLLLPKPVPRPNRLHGFFRLIKPPCLKNGSYYTTTRRFVQPKQKCPHFQQQYSVLLPTPTVATLSEKNVILVEDVEILTSTVGAGPVPARSSWATTRVVPTGTRKRQKQSKGDKTMKPHIGIEDKHRDAVVKLLNRILSDEYVVYTKTRKFHWNVTGPQFHDLHTFFQAQYEELDGIVDDVAERVRALGGVSSGTLSEFLKSSRLQEKPGTNPAASAMLSALLQDHEELIRILRKDVETCVSPCGDTGTSDFLTGLMEKHEKMAWMLRAFAAKK